jgi:long-chain acyl-CoA synthetase
MRLAEDGEICVRGANVFTGYWRRPDATAACLRDGWFRTGDRGDVDAAGNWRIVGRVKNVVVLSSGHNVAPDPIETELRQRIPACEQAVVVGHERPFLTAIVTGDVQRPHVDAALAAVNADLPHYKRVRAVHLRREPFSIENGFLTANGKLKRQLVLEHMAADIDAMYAQEAGASRA